MYPRLKFAPITSPFFWIENNWEEVTPSEISWSRLITPSRDLSPGIHVLMHEEGGRDFQGEIKSR